MKTALVANGLIECVEKLKPLISSNEKILAVDGGLHYLDKMGIVPNKIIGDFDSIEETLLKKYANTPQEKYPREKDETDLELALKSAKGQISIFGALGKRTDHTLYNLHLIRRSPHQITIETENETVFIVKNTQEIPTERGQTLSFLPLENVEGVTSSGLKWEFKNHTFDGRFMSISNMATAENVQISIKKGDLICFKLKR